MTGSCIEPKILSKRGWEALETIEEIWVDIKGAESYSVSSFGEVRNNSTDKLIKPHLTPNGILYVPLYIQGEKQARSVKVLVAEAFLEGKTKIFNTAINKDGDKRNNRVDNLAWRPRWYAIKYSRQFLKGKEFQHETKGPIHEIKTLDIFENIRQAGIVNGLLFRDVYGSCRSGAPVFPTLQIFAFDDSIQPR